MDRRSLNDTIRTNGFRGIAALVTFLCAVGSVNALNNDTVIQGIEDHYRELRTLKAAVVQKNLFKSIGKTKTFKGTLFIKKPGKLRLDYTNGQRIVIDGSTVWFYSRTSEQVIRRTFTDFEHANIPVAFLLGAATIRNDFDVIQPQAQDACLLDLIPKKPGAIMKKISIRSDNAGRITEMKIFDTSGNISTIQFTDVQEGMELAEKLFRFSVPKGTEIIDQ